MSLVAVGAFWTPRPEALAETVSGPIPAEVVRIIDGDTIVVRARIWLDQWVETSVRLADVDTPELRSRCPAEKDAAKAAKALTETWLSQGEKPGQIVLTDVRSGKYAGRIVAHIKRLDRADLSTALIDAGVAKPYDGGPRHDWCR